MATLKTFNFANAVNPVFLCIKERAKKAGVGYRDPFSHPATGLFGYRFDPAKSTNVVVALHILEARIALERAAFKLLKLSKAAYLSAAIGKSAWTNDFDNAITVVEAFPTATVTVQNLVALKGFKHQPERNIWYDELQRACRYLATDEPTLMFDHEVRYYLDGCVPFGRRKINPDNSVDYTNLFLPDGTTRIKIQLAIINNSVQLEIRDIIFTRFYANSIDPSIGGGLNTMISDGPFVITRVGTTAPAYRIVIATWDKVTITSPLGVKVKTNVPPGDKPITQITSGRFLDPPGALAPLNYIVSQLGSFPPIPPQSTGVFDFSVIIASDFLIPVLVPALEAGDVRFQLGEASPALATTLYIGDSTNPLIPTTIVNMLPNTSGSPFKLNRRCTGAIAPTPPPSGPVIISGIAANPLRTCPPNPFVTIVNVTVKNNASKVCTVKPGRVLYRWEMVNNAFAGAVPGVRSLGVTPKSAVVNPGAIAVFNFQVETDVRVDPPDGSTGRVTIEAAMLVEGIQRTPLEEPSFAIYATAVFTVIKNCGKKDPVGGHPPVPYPPPPPIEDPNNPPPPPNPEDPPIKDPPGDEGGATKSIFGFSIIMSLVTFVYNGDDGSGANPGSKQISPHDPAMPHLANAPNAARVLYTFLNPWSFPIRVTIPASPSLDPGALLPELTPGLYLHDPHGVDVTDQFTIAAVGPTTVDVPGHAGSLDEFGVPNGPSSPSLEYTVKLKNVPDPNIGIVVMDAIATGIALASSNANEIAEWGDDLAWKIGNTIYADPGSDGGEVMDPDMLEVIYKKAALEGSGMLLVLSSSAVPPSNTAGTKMNSGFFLDLVINYQVQNLRNVPINIVAADPNIGSPEFGNLDAQFTFGLPGMPFTVPALSTANFPVHATSVTPLYQQFFTALLDGAIGARVATGGDVSWALSTIAPGTFLSRAVVQVPRQSSFPHTATSITLAQTAISFASQADFLARTRFISSGTRGYDIAMTLKATCYENINANVQMVAGNTLVTPPGSGFSGQIFTSSQSSPVTNLTNGATIQFSGVFTLTFSWTSGLPAPYFPVLTKITRSGSTTIGFGVRFTPATPNNIESTPVIVTVISAY